jgi:hypothetical protein
MMRNNTVEIMNFRLFVPIKLNYRFLEACQTRFPLSPIMEFRKRMGLKKNFKTKDFMINESIFLSRRHLISLAKYTTLGA